VADIRSFRDLEAWQVGMRVVEHTYVLTADFPDGERYGLVTQMRRASVSIPSNVAEGNALNKPRWTIRFLLNAIGSSCELATHLEIALRLRFCTAQQSTALTRDLELLQKLLYGLKRERERRLMSAGATLAAAIFAAAQFVQ
jgi:four helix bundle protein